VSKNITKIRRWRAAQCRFLVDDPVYRAKYNQYVRETANGAFAVGPTQARYQAAHDLIKAYVVGPEGELPESTMLSSTAAFESSVNELVTHLQGRHAAAETYLAGQP
jgi:spore coat protein H